MVSTAADFLKLAALKRTTVDVQGQAVHVRELSVRERAELLDLMKGQPGMVPAWLVQKCALSDDGRQLFTEKEADALAASAPSVVDAVAAAVMRVSGMSEGESPNG